MLLFDDGIDQILVDGYVTRPAITRTFTTKLSTDKQVADRVLKDFKMDRVRGIFVSHSHYDHVMDVPYFAVKCNADVYGSQSTLNVARGGGVKENVIHSFDDSLEYEIGNFKIKVFHSKHSKPTAINNDLGQTIDYPLHQPTKMHGYVEGGSFDFLITNKDKSFLVRPSYNYVKGELDGVHADVLFAGITRMSKDTPENRTEFFSETIAKVKPKTVIPVHWDSLFSPLYSKPETMPKISNDTATSMSIMVDYCLKHQVNYLVQLPLTTMDY